ncbi:hypothetical protein F7234_20065 [Pseudomonas putida]|uniref:hypothetical protein n=1 Tax=Pseudomonas putida TaxID=303 RepID=UPI00125FD1C0|nr:hypothetical protein [Pseudomonas putida]KAB5620664.1 hypothetical protein F7234_20065 [Pseudomonas putida]
MALIPLSLKFLGVIFSQPPAIQPGHIATPFEIGNIGVRSKNQLGKLIVITFGRRIMIVNFNSQGRGVLNDQRASIIMPLIRSPLGTQIRFLENILSPARTVRVDN